MKTIIISIPLDFENEISTLIRLIEAGAEYFHLRKPNSSVDDIRRYIDLIPKEYHSKIILHQHYDLIDIYEIKGIHFSSRTTDQIDKYSDRDIHKSCSTHNFEEIENLRNEFDYIFLSPIFDSISKQGYSSKFSEFELGEYLKTSDKDIVALGGIDSQTASKCAEIGFSGVASLGYIWNPAINGDSDKSIENFNELKGVCEL